MKLRFTLAIVFILFLVRLETPAAPARQAAQVTLPQQGPVGSPGATRQDPF